MAAPATAPLPRFVELVRVSSAGQADRDTPADQRAALDRLRLQRPGVLVERIELQVSGAAAGADRPDLQRVTALARDRAFDELRVRHLDRLTRHENPAERFTIFSVLADAGAVIVDAGGRVTDPRSELGELDYYIQTMVAARERKRILERTMAAKARLAASGRLVCSTPPWGRTFDKTSGRWGVDVVQIAVYRRLFDLVLRGRSLRQICDELNGDGVTTGRGRPWTHGAISNFIRAEHAIGIVRSHGAVIQVPPVVDAATQAAALARFAAADHGSGRHDPVPALIRKLAVCGACGARLYTDRFGWTRNGKRKAWSVYYCSARDPACYVAHRVELVDQVVKGAVEAWARRPGALRAAAAGQPDDATEARREEAGAARELRRLAAEELRVGRLLSRGQLTRATGERLLAEVAARRAAAERQAEAARARQEAAARWQEMAAEAEARVAAIRAGLDRAGFAEWRELVELLFPPGSVALHPNGRIELRGALPLDAAGEDALRQAAAREPSVPSRVSGQFPVRLEAWAARHR